MARLSVSDHESKYTGSKGRKRDRDSAIASRPRRKETITNDVEISLF